MQIIIRSDDCTITELTYVK